MDIILQFKQISTLVENSTDAEGLDIVLKKETPIHPDVLEVIKLTKVLLEKAKKEWNPNILGAAIFGSNAREPKKTHNHSDVDLVVFVSEKISLEEKIKLIRLMRQPPGNKKFETFVIDNLELPNRHFDILEQSIINENLIFFWKTSILEKIIECEQKKGLTELTILSLMQTRLNKNEKYLQIKQRIRKIEWKLNPDRKGNNQRNPKKTRRLIMELDALREKIKTGPPENREIKSCSSKELEKIMRELFFKRELRERILKKHKEEEKVSGNKLSFTSR